MKYLVTYDLVESRKSYQNMESVLVERHDGWQAWDGAWVVESEMTVPELFAEFRPYVYGDADFGVHPLPWPDVVIGRLRESSALMAGGTNMGKVPVLS
jgi:hypothetical protein